MFSAFYEVATGRAPMMLRAYLLAVLIQMIVVNSLAEMGYLQVTIPPFFGAATLLGGLVFGVGMFLAIGCAGAVLYRSGEGRFDYIVATLSYVIAAWASNNWLVNPIRAALGGESALLTLNRALTVDRWLVVALIVTAGLLWIMRGERQLNHGSWDWGRTGFFLGCVGIAAWVLSASLGKPIGLGTMQGSDSLATVVLERDLSALSWSMYVLVAIPIGSFIAARRRGISTLKPFKAERIPQALAGGTLMGFGAAVAAGDNILHGLSGVPLLAVGSIAFMICAFIAVAALTRFEPRA